VLTSGFTTSAETFRNYILEAVGSFSGSSPRLDDITLVVIARDSNEKQQENQ
jgi:serine phosphatase RsbU (regulator of sigma subunit)